MTNDHKTPLMLAVVRGYSSSIELLVSYGADLDKQDAEGDTILHLAVMRYSVAEIVADQPSGAEHSSPTLDTVSQWSKIVSSIPQFMSSWLFIVDSNVAVLCSLVGCFSCLLKPQFLLKFR